MRCYALLILLMITELTSNAGTLPAELSDLASALANDQKAFEEGLRNFHKAQQQMAEGESEAAALLARDGKTDEAEAEMAKARQRMLVVRQGYETGLEVYAGSARLHNYYGELLYDIYGEQAAALKHWNLALSYDDKLSAPYNNLGLHFFHNGLYEEGLRNLDTALKLERDNPDYLFNMAQIYLVHFPQIQRLRKWNDKEKVYKEAMKFSMKAAKLAPDDYEILQDLAVNYYAAENFGVKPDWKAAAKAWQTARAQARTQDERFYTWLNEARVWIRDERKDQARTCLEEALALRPQSDIAQQLLQQVGGGATPDKVSGEIVETPDPLPPSPDQTKGNFARTGPRMSPERPRGLR